MNREQASDMVDALLIKWAEVGVYVANMDLINGVMIMDIIVPEHNTDRKTEDGEELAGELLATRVKESLEEANPGGKYEVTYRIAKGVVMNDYIGFSLARMIKKELKEAREENGGVHS